jgi:hypothetical protein
MQKPALVDRARMVRQFPIALGMIEQGELHLTGLLLLRDHLTWNNHDELLRAAAHKTKNEVLLLLAQRFPRPDAPARVQPLPIAPSYPQRGIPAAASASAEALAPRAPQVEPLSPERYKVQFTASAELIRKIDRAVNRRLDRPTREAAVRQDDATPCEAASQERPPRLRAESRTARSVRARRRAVRFCRRGRPALPVQSIPRARPPACTRSRRRR